MPRIQTQAGQSMLEGYVKKPSVGLCELVWNAFDEDASTVDISIETNELGGIEQIIVEDDGNGMTMERASSSFATVGDSWKRVLGTLSQGKRPVHGRHGRGRYAAFGLGHSVQWRSTAVAVKGGLATVHIAGSRSDIQYMDVNGGTAETPKIGTRVTIGLITDEALTAFDQSAELRTQLLTEFALHLDRFRDFKILFLGDAIQPETVIETKETLPLSLPEHIEGTATLTVIEWMLTDVERRLYLLFRARFNRRRVATRCAGPRCGVHGVPTVGRLRSRRSNDVGG